MFKFFTVGLELFVGLLRALAILLEFHSVVQVGLKSLCHVRKLSFHRRVPVVLDSVVRAAIEHLRDVSPPVVKQPVHQEENPLLFTGPASSVCIEKTLAARPLVTTTRAAHPDLQR